MSYTDARLKEIMHVYQSLSRDYRMRLKGYTVSIRSNWLPSVSFSARIALLKDGAEVDHGLILIHQFLDGEVFETQGGNKGLMELASDGFRSHTADEVLSLWRAYGELPESKRKRHADNKAEHHTTHTDLP